MPTAKDKIREEKDELDELRAALDAETQLRLDAEGRLRQTQSEFEEFVLSAAHDIREPLRSVSAYCELLARDGMERSASETDQFRRYILDGASRIQALVGSMVDCVTAASGGGYPFPVDMNEVFREAASPAGLRPMQQIAQMTCDPLPAVAGDFEKFVKVFRHLLDNATRYCEDPQPRIHVSAAREGSDWLFMVQDNGPGIEAVYRQRIFEPFKRLHSRQYTGSGLGLTFCRKAIESHGGRIWVESIPGQGSTFCFTLPATD